MLPETMTQAERAIHTDLAIFAYDPLADIAVHNGKSYMEWGGELPASFVNELRGYGAEVLIYRHKGTVATVVEY